MEPKSKTAINISDSLFALATLEPDPEEVKRLSNLLYTAYQKAIEHLTGNANEHRAPEAVAALSSKS